VGTIGEAGVVSNRISIALIGQAAFGESVVNGLVEQGEKIVAVFCPPDREGKPPDPIKVAADSHGIPVYQFKRMRDQVAIDAFKALNADLGVMAFVTDIVPEDILNAPRLGTIQYHPSLLPKHRGPSSINWPIIRGEEKTGLTIFWPDAGLDTGPILMQKEVEIGPNDTLGTVYFEKLFPLGVEAMKESVAMVRQGTAPKIEQDESQATYESWCKAKDCVIDWSKPIDDIHNLIRGADPSPGAGAVFRGKPVQVYSASKHPSPDADAEPGTITQVSDEGVDIAVNGGSIRIGRVRGDGGKVGAAEWAKETGAKEGERFEESDA